MTSKSTPSSCELTHRFSNKGTQELTRPKGILFDHDGVLVDSEDTHLAAWRQALLDESWPQDLAFIEANAGQGALILLESYAKHYSLKTSPNQIQSILDRKNQYYSQWCTQTVRLYQGVKEGLQSLHEKGIALAVVSNSRKKDLHQSLNHFEIAHYFNIVLSREDVSYPKPDPRAYLDAAGLLGVHPQKESYVIEDSPPGLSAGLLAGIPSCAVTTNFSTDHLKQPVLGRPDLEPVWIGPSCSLAITWLLSLPALNP